jgi:hypothetical protein
VLNVGAGSGNYEPTERRVVGLEPSITLIRQRPPDAARAVEGAAEHLQVARVSRRQVFLLFDVDRAHEYWLVEEYFPAAAALDHESVAPRASDVDEHLDVPRVEVVPVPADCRDGFGCSFWNRPEAHLDPDVMAGMSWTALIDAALLAEGVEHLRADLDSGEWDRRHGHLRELTEKDYGYRLVVAGD